MTPIAVALVSGGDSVPAALVHVDESRELGTLVLADGQIVVRSTLRLRALLDSRSGRDSRSDVEAALEVAAGALAREARVAAEAMADQLRREIFDEIARGEEVPT